MNRSAMQSCLAYRTNSAMRGQNEPLHTLATTGDRKHRPSKMQRECCLVCRGTHVCGGSRDSLGGIIVAGARRDDAMTIRAATPVQVMSSRISSTPSASFLQRKCSCERPASAGGECSECKKKADDGAKVLRRYALSAPKTDEAPPIVRDVLRESGEPISREVRQHVESAFGRDFSAVRIHNGSLAARSAQSVNAVAYTVGSHIVFDGGQYAPENVTGRRLLAHELTHTVQAGFTSPPTTDQITIGEVDGPQAAEADRVAASVVDSGTLPPAMNVGLATESVLRR